MPHEPTRPPTSPTNKSRPTPTIQQQQQQQHIHHPPPKSFVLSQYSCKGFTQFDSSDYNERGRPRCYGIERKIASSAQLRDQFRSMLANDDSRRKSYDDDDFFDNFKDERGKIIAAAGGDGDVAFRFRGYGTTRYPVMEYADGSRRESVTLQKPVVDPGLMVTEEADGDTFFVFKISGYEISNDVRGMYDDEMRKPDDGASTKTFNQRRQHDDERDFDRHMVEIEIDLDKTGEKIWEIASKTVENAKKVGGIVTEEMRDDFVPRVSEMSQRIVDQFPKTAVRCKKTAEDIVKWWQQADEDDEE